MTYVITPNGDRLEAGDCYEYPINRENDPAYDQIVSLAFETTSNAFTKNQRRLMLKVLTLSEDGSELDWDIPVPEGHHLDIRYAGMRKITCPTCPNLFTCVLNGTLKETS